MSLYLHSKHGVAPALTFCRICGKDANELALLGISADKTMREVYEATNGAHGDKVGYKEYEHNRIPATEPCDYGGRDMSKLEQLAEVEGLDIMEILEQGTSDGICLGICTNKDCDYTTEVEPDCGKGFCENCQTNTVKSALMLAGMI